MTSCGPRTAPKVRLHGSQTPHSGLLTPGESRTIEFEITPDLLKFYDVNMKYVVEAGDFEIMVGNSSRDVDLKKVILAVQ